MSEDEDNDAKSQRSGSSSRSRGGGAPNFIAGRPSPFGSLMRQIVGGPSTPKDSDTPDSPLSRSSLPRPSAVKPPSVASSPAAPRSPPRPVVIRGGGAFMGIVQQLMTSPDADERRVTSSEHGSSRKSSPGIALKSDQDYSLDSPKGTSPKHSSAVQFLIPLKDSTGKREASSSASTSPRKSPTGASLTSGSDGFSGLVQQLMTGNSSGSLNTSKLNGTPKPAANEVSNTSSDNSKVSFSTRSGLTMSPNQRPWISHRPSDVSPQPNATLLSLLADDSTTHVLSPISFTGQPRLGSPQHSTSSERSSSPSTSAQLSSSSFMCPKSPPSFGSSSTLPISPQRHVSFNDTIPDQKISPPRTVDSPQRRANSPQRRSNSPPRTSRQSTTQQPGPIPPQIPLKPTCNGPLPSSTISPIATPIKGSDVRTPSSSTLADSPNTSLGPLSSPAFSGSSSTRSKSVPCTLQQPQKSQPPQRARMGGMCDPLNVSIGLNQIIPSPCHFGSTVASAASSSSYPVPGHSSAAYSAPGHSPVPGYLHTPQHCNDSLMSQGSILATPETNRPRKAKRSSKGRSSSTGLGLRVTSAPAITSTMKGIARRLRMPIAGPVTPRPSSAPPPPSRSSGLSPTQLQFSKSKSTGTSTPQRHSSPKLSSAGSPPPLPEHVIQKRSHSPPTRSHSPSAGPGPELAYDAKRQYRNHTRSSAVKWEEGREAMGNAHRWSPERRGSSKPFVPAGLALARASSPIPTNRGTTARSFHCNSEGFVPASQAGGSTWA